MQFLPKLPDKLPEYITAPQLAKLLLVSTNTVRNWSNAGTLPPPVRVSPRLYLYRTRDVRRALAKLFPELQGQGGQRDQVGQAKDDQGGVCDASPGGDASLAG